MYIYLINNTLIKYILIFIMSFLFNINAAISDENKISSLKVAYIYNIAKFTRWPPSTWDKTDAPFFLCAYGNDDVSNELNVLMNKKIDTHPISVVKVKSDEDYQHCNAIYISTDERNIYRYLLSKIDLQLVLTITDQNQYFKYGGFINLIEENKRLRFQVSNQQLSTTKLVLSSKLLKLSILVDN